MPFIEVCIVMLFALTFHACPVKMFRKLLQVGPFEPPMPGLIEAVAIGSSLYEPLYVTTEPFSSKGPFAAHWGPLSVPVNWDT
jgi:hypothetical protein